MKAMRRPPAKTLVPKREVSSSVCGPGRRTLVLLAFCIGGCNLAVPAPVDPKIPEQAENCRDVQKRVKSGTRRGTREVVVGSERIRNRYGEHVGSRDQMKSVAVNIPYRNVSYVSGGLKLDEEALARIVGDPADIAELDSRRAAFAQVGEVAISDARSGKRLARVGIGVTVVGALLAPLMFVSNNGLRTAGLIGVSSGTSLGYLIFDRGRRKNRRANRASKAAQAKADRSLKAELSEQRLDRLIRKHNRQGACRGESPTP